MALLIFLIIIGLAILIGGAEALVRGASSLAKRLGVSPLVIGLTIVAFGTSAPELVVNMYAALGGTTDIAIGNIVGSNIANILLIVGISASIFPLAVQHSTTWKEVPFALLASVLVFVMGNDMLIDGVSFSSLTRTDGIALIALFIIFMYYTVGLALAEKGQQEDDVDTYTYPFSIFYILIGSLGLFFGGKLLVDNASELGRIAGLSESLIGLTVVAIGTSLPELATSVVAAYRKETDLAIGNIVGSNIFNVFWILGLTSIITPVPFNTTINADVLVAVGATLLLFIFILIGGKKKFLDTERQVITRWEGIVFLLLYIGYTGYVIARG